MFLSFPKIKTPSWTCQEHEDEELQPAPLGTAAEGVCPPVAGCRLCLLFVSVPFLGQAHLWSDKSELYAAFKMWPHGDLCAEWHHGWTPLTPGMGLNVLVLHGDKRSSHASYLGKAVFQNCPGVKWCQCFLYSGCTKRWETFNLDT